MATREQGVRKSDMAKRLSAHGPQIDRLFNLRHSSKVGQIDEAFRALGKRVDIDVPPGSLNRPAPIPREVLPAGGGALVLALAFIADGKGRTVD